MYMYQIHGTIQASTDRSAYNNDISSWLVFKDVHNLAVQSGGTINGNGKIWWKNSCKVNHALVLIMPLLTSLPFLFLFIYYF